MFLAVSKISLHDPILYTNSKFLQKPTTLTCKSPVKLQFLYSTAGAYFH